MVGVDARPAAERAPAAPPAPDAPTPRPLAPPAAAAAAEQAEPEAAAPLGLPRRAPAAHLLGRHLDVGDVALVAARQAEVVEGAREPAPRERPEGRARRRDDGEVGLERVGDEADAEVRVVLLGDVVVPVEEVQTDGADGGDAAVGEREPWG